MIAHEAVHSQIPDSAVDVYSKERLFQFLGSQNPLGVNLTAVAINNPDSIVTFAFQTLELKGGQNIVPEYRAKHREHLTFAAKLEIGVRSQESGARRKEEEGRRKEPEEVFLQI
jgi:hypothetical protein